MNETFKHKVIEEFLNSDEALELVNATERYVQDNEFFLSPAEYVETARKVNKVAHLMLNYLLEYEEQQ